MLEWNCKVIDQTVRFGKLSARLPKATSEDMCKALFVPSRIELEIKIVSPMLLLSFEVVSQLPPPVSMSIFFNEESYSRFSQRRYHAVSRSTSIDMFTAGGNLRADCEWTLCTLEPPLN